MRRIDHAGEGLGRAGVRGDDPRAVENRDRVLVQNDVDVVAHEPVRHAVPHRVDVDECIGRDPAAELLVAAGQRPDRRRAERRALVPIKPHERGLTGRPVSPLISDGRHPRAQMLLERGEGVEGLVGQGIALHVFDARFGLALGPRPIRCARAWLHVPIPAEGQVAG